MKILPILFISILLSTGCSTFNIQDPSHKLAIQYATGQYIEQGNTVVRAEKVIAYAEEAKTLLDFQGFSVTAIKDRLKERVMAEGLSPSDSLLALTLIDMVQVKVNQDINKGIIDPTTKVTLNEVLNAIISVSKMYL